MDLLWIDECTQKHMERELKSLTMSFGAFSINQELHQFAHLGYARWNTEVASIIRGASFSMEAPATRLSIQTHAPAQALGSIDSNAGMHGLGMTAPGGE